LFRNFPIRRKSPELEEVGEEETLVLKGEGADDLPSSSFRLPAAGNCRKKRADKMPVPERSRHSSGELEADEVSITTQPNPAWRETASQLERGKLL